MRGDNTEKVTLLLSPLGQSHLLCPPPAHKSKKKRRNITQSRSKKGVGTRGFKRDGFVFASVSCILRSNISIRIYKCYITFGLSFMQIFHPPHTLPKDEMCFYEKESAGVLVAAKRTLVLQLGTTFRFVRASQPQLCNRPRLRREGERVHENAKPSNQASSANSERGIGASRKSLENPAGGGERGEG